VTLEGEDVWFGDEVLAYILPHIDVSVTSAHIWDSATIVGFGNGMAKGSQDPAPGTFENSPLPAARTGHQNQR
jgi:hypothetical protein